MGEQVLWMSEQKGLIARDCVGEKRRGLAPRFRRTGAAQYLCRLARGLRDRKTILLAHHLDEKITTSKAKVFSHGARSGLLPLAFAFYNTTQTFRPDRRGRC
jgi:hypothetical protein